MINSKKKGFTIVELVIVIAVIAILSAVLIPTFSNLVKKANTSADIQAVRQMNTHLAINEVTEGKTINDVFLALKGAGMTSKDYTPLSSDTYFFWDEKENRILYTDKDGNVIYPEEYKTATKANGWYSLSGTIDETSAVIQLDKNEIKNNTNNEYTITNAADMSKLIKFVDQYRTEFNLGGKTLTINISNDIDLMGADLSFGDLTKTNIVINGNGNEIKGLYVSDNHATSGNDSEGKPSTYGAALFIRVNNFEANSLTIKNSITGSVTRKQCAIFVGQISGEAKFVDVTVDNCVVNGMQKTGILAGYTHGKITLTNVTLTNNTVVSGEGETGVLFGVCLYDQKDGHFIVSNLTLNNNSIKLDSAASTFEVSSIDGFTEKELPINKLFVHKANPAEGGRVGIAHVCFVAPKAFGTTQTNNQTINGVKVNMAKAVNDIDALTSK